jgi:hypothetical protein
MLHLLTRQIKNHINANQIKFQHTKLNTVDKIFMKCFSTSSQTASGSETKDSEQGRIEIRCHYSLYEANIAHPEENWHNSKSNIFQEKQLICVLIRVFIIEESETANTYVGEKGIVYT